MAIRIAFFFTTLELGGAERQALLLLDHIDRKTFAVHAYTMVGGPLEADLRKRKIPVRNLGASPASIAADIGKVRSWIKQDKIDVLHCLLWHPNMLGRFACIGTKARCINSVRWAERQVLRDFFDSASRFLVHRWIANSSWGAQLAHLPKSKTSIIHNGLSQSLLDTPLSAWKPKQKSVIMVGQFRREKRHDVLLQAAKLLPEWSFTLVGDGPLYGQTKALARSLANVTFLGQRSDVRELLLKNYCSVLVSSSEGNPNVALESLALGVPFIGSDIDAHRSLLANSRGILTKTEPKALAKAITLVAKMDARSRDAMRKSGQAYVRVNYSAKRMAEQTQQVWEELSKR